MDIHKYLNHARKRGVLRSGPTQRDDGTHVYEVGSLSTDLTWIVVCTKDRHDKEVFSHAYESSDETNVIKGWVSLCSRTVLPPETMW